MRKDLNFLTVIGVAAITLAALSTSTIASDWEPVVLKATHVEDKGNTLKMHLTSGEVVEVAKRAYSQDWTTAVAKSLRTQEENALAASSSSPPSDAIAAGVIRRKCASEWPDDFSMRVYCEKQQNEGISKLRRRDMSHPTLARVRAKCADEWPDDFSMRDYCETQQVEALRQLGK